MTDAADGAGPRAARQVGKDRAEPGGPAPAVRLFRLKQRCQFLKVARDGRKAVQPGLVLQALVRQQPSPSFGLGAGEPRACGSIDGGSIGVGFTASRKVGNAVARNRARRRLRALAAALLPQHSKAGYDLVLIARQATVTRGYAELHADLLRALRRLGLLRPSSAPVGESEGS